MYIDIFSRIQIFHNSVKLDLDGLATLRVRAFDSEGDIRMIIITILFVVPCSLISVGFLLASL